eukprot:355494-Chlamydomonas_euryale.AAC.6
MPLLTACVPLRTPMHASTDRMRASADPMHVVRCWSHTPALAAVTAPPPPSVDSPHDVGNGGPKAQRRAVIDLESGLDQLQRLDAQTLDDAGQRAGRKYRRVRTHAPGTSPSQRMQDAEGAMQLPAGSCGRLSGGDGARGVGATELGRPSAVQRGAATQTCARKSALELLTPRWSSDVKGVTNETY